MRFLDNVPLLPLIAISIFMGLAPFAPMPHLLEKLTMLSNGTLTKPIDIFDLLWHMLPSIVLVLKLIRMSQVKKSS